MGERFNRNVLFTCLGSPGKPVVDTVGPLLLQPGDRLLLCSDGLWGSVERRGDHRAARHARRSPTRCPSWSSRRCATAAPKSDNVIGARGRVGIAPKTATARSGISTADARRRGVRLDHPGQRARRRTRPTSSTKPRSSARSARSTRPSGARRRRNPERSTPMQRPAALRRFAMTFNGRAGRDALRPVTHHAPLHQARRRLGAGRVRRHQGAVHRVGRREGAAAQARQRRGLGHRRIRHAAARHPHPQRPRGRARQAKRPHAGDPAPDRPLAALRVRSGGARRAHDLARLRRDPGRRRHAHRGDHRRLRRRARCGDAGCWRRASSARRRSATSSPRCRSASSRARRCSTSNTSKTRPATPT